MKSLLWNFSIQFTMNYMFVQIFVNLIHVRPILHSQVIVWMNETLDEGKKGEVSRGSSILTRS